jgi:3-oxoacyl-[acyl-carrier protein] reductase
MTELFERFEVNREPRWQVLTKLAGASLVLHLVLVWMVVYVPAFRDTLNIAALIASTKIVDRPYERTQIGDDVQLVQLEKFHYPDGYFTANGQVAAEVPPQPTPDPFAAKIISQASSAKNVQPETSPSPTPEPSPSPTASLAPSASPSPIAQASSSPSSSPLTPEEAQKQLEKTAAQNNVPLPEENQINKKALKDFAAYASNLKNQGKLDLDKPFEMVIEAELDEQGKLKNAQVTKKEGDENLVDLFRNMVAALNDSGLLIYLKPISKDNPGAKVKITVKQGDKEVLASVESEATSPESAQSLAKTLNNFLYLGAWSRAGKDEEVLMKNTNATPDGKKVVVNFSMPRQSVVDMIKKQLEPGV